MFVGKVIVQHTSWLNMPSMFLMLGSIIEGIRNKLQDFRQVHISHVRWQGNRPAHILAQYA